MTLLPAGPHSGKLRPDGQPLSRCLPDHPSRRRAALPRLLPGSLGFEATYWFPSEDDPLFVSLELEGGKLGLGFTDHPVESASTSIWLYTDDLDDAVGGLEGAGVRVVAAPEDKPWGERVASVADPDGYVIHLGATI